QNIELVKVGSGSLTLTGTQDNGGEQAIVNGGVLVLAKDPSSTSPDVHAAGRLTINGGTAELAGSGGDQISNGDPAGPSFNGSGAFDLNGRSETIGGLSGAGTLAFELGAASSYDQLTVTGSVDLTGSTLQVSLGYTPAIGDSFTIIRNYGYGPVSGTFAG